jgi:transmembrane sensor
MSSESPTGDPLSAEQLARTAANWVDRRNRGLSADEREAFTRWMQQSPGHRAAFASADRSADEFDWVWHVGGVPEAMAGLERLARRRRKRRTATTCVLAVVVVALLVSLRLTGPGWLSHRYPATDLTLGAAPHTRVLQPATQLLEDQSQVELAAGARLTVAFTPELRRVTLAGGAGYFKVAKNPKRPFIVRAEGVDVRAVGTQFVVQPGATGVEVVVTEGRVAVTDESSSRPVFVDAGFRVVLPARGALHGQCPVEPLTQDMREESLGWRIPRLRFSNSPLSEVVAMMNRYNRLQFVIGNKSLDNLRLSGVLRSDKTDALVEMLESDLGIAATPKPDSTILLLKAD